MMRTFVNLAALTAPAQPTPTPAPPRDSGTLPDGPVARFLVDPWGHVRAVPAWVWHTVHADWPLVVVAAVLLLALRVLVAALVGWVRLRLAGRARWLEIVPPAKLPTKGAVAWWSTLAGIVAAKRWGLPGRRRLAVEFLAAKTGVRAGVWVPRSMPVLRIERLIPQVWPGAKVVVGQHPPMWTGMRVSAVERFPRGGEWTPLMAPTSDLFKLATDPGEELLRVALAALDEHTQDGKGVAGVQLIVTRQRRTSPRSRSWAHTIGWAPVRLIVALIDAVASPNRTAAERERRERPEVDRVVTAGERAQDAKRAAGPHLHVTVRALAATQRGGGRTAGRWRGEAMQAAAAGFYPVAPSASLGSRRVWRARTRVAARIPGRGFAATVPELAALWHLPAEPGLYGMTGNAARTRSPGRDLPRMHGWQPETEGDETENEGDGDV